MLSLDTGYERDYGEGVAYREYFSTDRLMFNVPQTDTRLENKAEILGLRFPEKTEQVLAIAADYLNRHPLYVAELDGTEVIVVTDKSGANRDYESGMVEFESWDHQSSLTDIDGRIWQLTEAGLVGPTGQTLRRLPAYRAFWFGWFSQHPETHLIF